MIFKRDIGAIYNMLKYFAAGIKIWDISIFRYAIYLNILLVVFIILRRLFAVLQSHGNFFAPYHITDGVFYIHNAFIFGKRIMPLDEIKHIDIKYIHGVKLNGSRYMLYVERKYGRKIVVIFGKTKNNEKLVEDLKKETRKYSIKISEDIS